MQSLRKPRMFLLPITHEIERQLRFNFDVRLRSPVTKAKVGVYIPFRVNSEQLARNRHFQLHVSTDRKRRPLSLQINNVNHKRYVLSSAAFQTNIPYLCYLYDTLTDPQRLLSMKYADGIIAEII